MDDDIDAQRLCHRIDRDVVVRRPDAARREQIVVARTQLVDGLDNGVLDVGHHAYFAQADALQVQP